MSRFGVRLMTVGLALSLMTALSTPATGTDQAVPSGSEDVANPHPSKPAPDDRPRDHIEFSSRLTADCMLHQAQLRQVVNTDPERAIRVVLWNYTGRTRSQGSSTKILQPGAQPTPLGCDGTAGLDRRWEIESAEFVAPESP